MYPRNAISSVTAAITAIESNAPTIVANGHEEREIETEGARTGIRLGNSNRSATSAMIPNSIAGIAARQMCAAGHVARERVLRASRVAGGGPRPVQEPAYRGKSISVKGRAQGISGGHSSLPSNARNGAVEP